MLLLLIFEAHGYEFSFTTFDELDACTLQTDPDAIDRVQGDRCVISLDTSDHRSAYADSRTELILAQVEQRSTSSNKGNDFVARIHDHA